MKRLIYCFSILISSGLYAQQNGDLLTLQDAISQALNANFNIQIANNTAEIATVENNWGNAGRLPNVTGSAGYNISSNNLDQRLSNGTTIKRNGATFQREDLSVGATWGLFNGFSVLAAKERLNELERMGKLDVRQQSNQLAYNVITAYLNILKNLNQKIATEEAMELVAERMRLAENRFNIGVASKSDYLQAVVDYNEAKNSIINLEKDIANSKVDLNELLARTPDLDFTTTELIDSYQLPVRAEILQSIDTLSPLLLLARSEQLVLLQRKIEINAQRLPSVNLNTGLGLSNTNNSAGFTLRNTTYGPTAGIGIVVPIFNGGVVKQQLKVNDIQYKNQDIYYNQLRNSLLSGLANAYNNYTYAKQQFELEVINLKSVEENSMIAMERFRKADITTVELRQTQLNLIQSQQRKIAAQYQMKQSEADILLIMGKLVQ